MAGTIRRIVPLESGDRLTREEFHRRYVARPDIFKAELVNGVVYVTRRVTAAHGAATSSLCGWAGVYAASHPDVGVSLRVTTFMGASSEVQPDVLVLHKPALGGRLRVTDDDYLEGSPDLIAEAASSSASYDLHDKKRVYQQTGVAEYIVWQLYENRIDWFRLVNGAYVRVEADQNGIIESSLFPGLRLHVAKMLAGDLAGVLAALTGAPPTPGS